MGRFASVLISFRNAGADSPSPATQIRIGSKPSGSSSPNQARAEPMENATPKAFASPDHFGVVDLREALRERLTIIHDEESRRDPETHMTRLSAVSEKINKLEAALPRPIDPQLAHYLKRRSYDKALEFLESL